MELPEKNYFLSYKKRKELAFNTEKTNQEEVKDYSLTKIAFDERFHFESDTLQIDPF